MNRTTSKVTLKRTSDGYQADNGRFQIARKPGRSYTRGPFHTYWDIADRQTGKSQVGLYSLNDVRAWILNALENAK
ncbi:hypothetical protein QFZ34_001246 [Phyllobacterium ifriqiyense]|uniref:Uncharacterized protein n=1 Tax=Phyllobacterium ifriqiyense TaxID=314238 RepID=A0ABU0S5R0_9HYPH|nr:hypothetical protein [Phyllobacterium ifriqiyense]